MRIRDEFLSNIEQTIVQFAVIFVEFRMIAWYDFVIQQYGGVV